jgi:transcriptional regulator with XRE-family HTH domain
MRTALIRQVRAQRRMPSPALARAIREAAGVSQGRIAEELGVDRVTVTRWETGLRRPRGERASAYAELLSQLKRAVE